MTRKYSGTPFSANWRGLTLEGTATFYPGRPGRTSGPPERCYPDEPAEVDIQTLTCEGSDALFLLGSSFDEEIQDAILESFNVEPDGPEYEPEFDEDAWEAKQELRAQDAAEEFKP